MEGITEFLEVRLHLPVNHRKSQVAPVKDVEFLGFQILIGKIRVSMKARKRFKDKVRLLTRRNNPYSMNQVIQKLNEYLRGWISCFRVQEFRQLLRCLDEFIRSRLRSMQLKKWKKPRKFQRMMIRAGFPVVKAKHTWIKMRRWQSVERPVVKFLMNLKWFRSQTFCFSTISPSALPNLGLLADRGAAYLAGTGRSVRRGWGHPPPTGIMFGILSHHCCPKQDRVLFLTLDS